jgi:ribosomal protein L14
MFDPAHSSSDRSTSGLHQRHHRLSNLHMVVIIRRRWEATRCGGDRVFHDNGAVLVVVFLMNTGGVSPYWLLLN